MEYIEVTGGNPLRGSIRPAAAKNSVLPLLAATLLCAQPCTLRRVLLLFFHGFSYSFGLLSLQRG